MSRAGLEPATYGLKEPGWTLASAHSRSNVGFDARGRSYALVSAVTVLVTVCPYDQQLGIALQCVECEVGPEAGSISCGQNPQLLPQRLQVGQVFRASRGSLVGHQRSAAQERHGPGPDFVLDSILPGLPKVGHSGETSE